MNAEARLQELGLTLPPIPRPAGVYKPVVVVGKTAYVSGHLPIRTDGTLITGRVGADCDEAGGKVAARQAGLGILASLRAHLGSLDRVERVVKIFGMVNSVPEFQKHPVIVNGCSELFADVFGPDNGVGARSSIGVGSLPANVAVEIEAVFELS